MDSRRVAVAAAFVLGSVLAGWASGLTAASTPQDYAELGQPSWAPPSWLFAPVWTALYAMIGLAGFLLWQAPDRGLALGLWSGQFALNLAWTPLFFALGWRGLALVDIGLLLGLLVACLRVFWPRDRRAAYLFLPYVAWVAFATALNAAMWSLNR